MADEPAPPTPSNASASSGPSKRGEFGRRGRVAPPVVLKAGEGTATPDTRRRIRALTLGLGAAGAAALAAFAAHQYSTRSACEDAVRQGHITGPECPASAEVASNTPSSATTAHGSAGHWGASGLHLFVGPLFRSSSSSYSGTASSSGNATSHGFSFGGFGSRGSAHGGGS